MLRNRTRQQLAQNPFCLSVANFEVDWQAPDKLNHSRIEKWRSHLESIGHAGAVNLGENVVGQEVNAVEIHHPGHQAPFWLGDRSVFEPASPEHEFIFLPV